ncbi:hypothetical protein D5H78_06000 [Vallicoccus soli]|uniref:Uncharacterized protein n=1 Tax=Vallicoccus soli TaxID=2339232 RepID=A0A3A3Z2B0_9ACTN|nr:hypothetical protein D5H78_06000 [Vallicoccus soli]
MVLRGAVRPRLERVDHVRQAHGCRPRLVGLGRHLAAWSRRRPPCRSRWTVGPPRVDHVRQAYGCRPRLVGPVRQAYGCLTWSTAGRPRSRPARPGVPGRCPGTGAEGAARVADGATAGAAPRTLDQRSRLAGATRRWERLRVDPG